MSKLEEYRIHTLTHTAKLKSMRDPWTVWQPIIHSKLGKTPNGNSIFQFGNHMSEVFKSNSAPGRGQSDLSIGGTAWECLNIWYLNLLFWGTPIVAVRTNKKLVPECLRNALTVTHSSVQTNTESDVSIFSVPEHELLESSKTVDLSKHLESRIGEVDLVNLQCKTNWNDNAQVPMLWDLIYNVDKFKLNTVSVGIKGVSPRSLKSFKYAFSTVPTVKMEKIKADSLSVLRVKNLSGGNYWGHSSKKGIATCINELPNNHFSEFYRDGGMINHLNRTLGKTPSFIDNFIGLDWV
jgi:hypothetical protein